MHTKMRKHNLLLVLALALALILAGACIGQLVENWNWFQYTAEFNLFELIYFIGSVLIASYLAYLLDKGVQDSRGEKDLFMEKYKEIDDGLKNLNDSFTITNNDEYTISNENVLSQMKTINVLIGRYQNALLRCYPSLNNNDNEYRKLSLKELRRLTTMNKRGDDTIRNVSGTWYYSDERMAQIKSELNKLRSECFEDILQINSL